MIKNFINIIFTLVLLTSCYAPSKEYLDKKVALENIKNIANNSCYLNKITDNNSNIVISFFTYSNSKYLQEEEKQILNDIITIYNSCPKNIMLVNYITTPEDLENSYNKNNLIKNYLNEKKIKANNILTLYCNTNSKNKNLSTLIIFLNSSKQEHYFDCFDNFN